MKYRLYLDPEAVILTRASSAYSLATKLMTPVEGFDVRQAADPRFRLLDANLRGSARSITNPVIYHDITRYLLSGYAAYSSAAGERIFYPGLPSQHGRSIDGLEGFARLLPLLASWLAGGRDRHLVDRFGTTHDLRSVIASGISAGVGPGPNSWGPAKDYDQRIVEAATIAYAVWLCRDWLPVELGQKKMAALASWLASACSQQTHDNNWHVLILLIEEVLKSLDYPTGLDQSWRKQRLHDFCVGDGWFRDGKDPRRVDYYNVWVYFYLDAIDQVNPQFDGAFIEENLAQFIKSYQMLLTRRGVPFFGRSISYRMASPLPLILAARRGLLPFSLARACLDAVTSFFVPRGALKDGVPTQGYFEADPRLLDRYTGPGGPLWSTMAIAAALQFDDAHSFWVDAPDEVLPSEKGAFRIALPGPAFTIVGDGAGDVVIERELGSSAIEFTPHGRWRRLAERLLQRPMQPHNFAAKYPDLVSIIPAPDMGRRLSYGHSATPSCQPGEAAV